MIGFRNLEKNILKNLSKILLINHLWKNAFWNYLCPNLEKYTPLPNCEESREAHNMKVVSLNDSFPMIAIALRLTLYNLLFSFFLSNSSMNLCNQIISLLASIATTYQESLIETQSQDRQNIYLEKPSRGRKPKKTSFV